MGFSGFFGISGVADGILAVYRQYSHFSREYLRFQELYSLHKSEDIQHLYTFQ